MNASPIMAALLHRGVTIICPESVSIDPAIDPERISRDGVVLHPGTRLRGSETLIGPGCVLGEEAPATLDNCGLGKRVHFRGGYAQGSVLLDDVTVGSGAQLRGGCLLEEKSSAAHTVGMKQTIVMPYATIGSVVNFCDAMLAGGTGPHDHSEVGSGFVHFNFAPTGTKATASLFGDVPRGVFLRQPRIFLGGQVGVVGPRRVGFGAVIGAGSLLRDDVADNEFVLTGPTNVRRPVVPSTTVKPERLARTVACSIDYIAQLRVLRMWYEQVRWAYCGRFRLGGMLNSMVSTLLVGAMDERAKRLREYAAAIQPMDEPGRQFVQRVDLMVDAAVSVQLPLDEGVVESVSEPALRRSAGYLETMASLDDDVVAQGEAWMRSALAAVRKAAGDVVPSLVMPF